MRILSIDGGGYLGLASAAFLAEQERHFGVRCHDCFDMFCGTSTGAIIALALASGKTAAEVLDLYKGFGPSVFYNPFPGVRPFRTWVRGVLFSRYSNRALRQALDEAFGEETLGDVKRRGKIAIVPAFSLSKGRPRVFKTDHHPDLTLDSGCRLSDVALASSAAPYFLPVVRLKSPLDQARELFCDGGLAANHPALLGLIEATYQLSVEPQTVQLLSMSTPRGELGESFTQPGFLRRWLLSRGILAWGSFLGEAFIDSGSRITDELLRRVFQILGDGKRYQRIEFALPTGCDLDVATGKATAALELKGSSEAQMGETRRRVQQFFTRKAGDSHG